MLAGFYTCHIEINGMVSGFHKKSLIFFLAMLVALAGLIAVELTGIAPWDDARKVRLDSDWGFRMDVLNVGKADCILIEADGRFALIDGGNNADAALIVDFLDARGVRVIDALVSTHPHEDHVGSLDAVILNYNVSQAYRSPVNFDSVSWKDFLSAAKKKNVPIQIPEPGDCFSLGNAKFTFLGPFEHDQEINDNSLVIRATYGERTFLLMGDAERKEETDMLDAHNLKSDVLKVGHHGSKTSTTDAFLSEVSPNVAFVTCDETGETKPSAAVLERLSKSGARVLRSDIDGTMGCVSDGKQLLVYTEKSLPELFSP